MNFKTLLKKWWLSIKYDPDDPRYGRGEIKIVAIGGGSGLSTVLRGLKRYSRNITAIVAVSDTGQSSGVIRKVFKTLPPGDIRKCLAALSDDYRLLTEAFEYRFPKGSGFLTGHPLGNIWLAALIEKYGSFEKALDATHHLLDTVGNVFPSTLARVQLGASYDGGGKVFGEERIPLVGKPIKKVFFNQKNIKAYKKSVEAIENADLIVIGPGSLYTSILPNLLIPSIRKAISANRRALRVYVANCSTERGETENMGVLEHIDAIERHAGENLFQYVLANKSIIRRSEKRHELGEINNITIGIETYKSYNICNRDLIDRKFPLYHDQDKLAKELILLYNENRK